MKCGYALSSVVLCCDNIVREWDLPGPSSERFHEMRMVTQLLQNGGSDGEDFELNNRLDMAIKCLCGDEIFFKLNDMAWDVMEAEAAGCQPLRRSPRIKAMNKVKA